MSYALIDGDVIVYRAAFAGQSNIDWNDGQDGLTVDTNEVIRVADQTIEQWLLGSRRPKAVICLSDRENFRKLINPDYKANRKSEKPQAFYAVQEHIKSTYKTMTLPGLEADDVMGILGTSENLDGAVIVSIDKDMLSVPAKVFNPDKMKKPVRIPTLMANYQWMLQTLSGDPVDGYKGVPKIGAKRAERLLGGPADVPSMWAIVVKAYLDAGLTETDAILNARMARILRREDYNKQTGDICLWRPNGEDEWRTLESLRPTQDVSVEKPTEASAEPTCVITEVTSETSKTSKRKRGRKNPSLVT